MKPLLPLVLITLPLVGSLLAPSSPGVAQLHLRAQADIAEQPMFGTSTQVRYGVPTRRVGGGTR